MENKKSWAFAKVDFAFSPMRDQNLMAWHAHSNFSHERSEWAEKLGASEPSNFGLELVEMRNPPWQKFSFSCSTSNLTYYFVQFFNTFRIPFIFLNKPSWFRSKIRDWLIFDTSSRVSTKCTRWGCEQRGIQSPAAEPKRPFNSASASYEEF